ncbi:GNAT family N-acetyltransferase, partial [Mesorhizobium sp. M0601]|uniref:GNAT family N-acetyltransferase n=1 Tax=Mesorhizobium sp. M0601 TaxID=2956969 RepID=UPI00333C1C5B
GFFVPLDRSLPTPAQAGRRLGAGLFTVDTARTLEDDIAGLRKLLAGDGFETSLVARIGDVPVGTCLLVRRELELAHELTPWLAGLAVAPKHQHQGIGTALVRATEARAASAGVVEFYL